MGQGNIKWTLLNKNKCFWRSQAILNIALHWPGLPSPSLHKILMTALFAWIGFLCPETTHKEPGTGNSYWVLKVFPGYCLRPDRNETTVGNQTERAKRIILGDLHCCSSFAIKVIKNKEQWLAFWRITPPKKTAFPGGKKGLGGEEEQWQSIISTGESGIIPPDAPLYIDAPPKFPAGLLHSSTLDGSFLAHLWN